MSLVIAMKTRSADAGAGPGKFWWTRGDLTDQFGVAFPFSVNTETKRSSKAAYRNRSYVCGGFTDNLVMDEHRRAHRQGMRGPNTPPAISVGAGTDVQVPYVSFFDEETQERSPLSPAGAAVTGNTTRSWTALPTQPPDDYIVLNALTTAFVGAATTITANGYPIGSLRPGDRIALSGDPTRFVTVIAITASNQVQTDQTLNGTGAPQSIIAKVATRATHIELWVQVNGALPRLAEQRQIGTLTATEAVATLALGEAFTDDFERFPTCSVNTVWHDRQVMAGDEQHPDTLYFSLLSFPERYGGFNLKTRNGDPIRAVVPVRDMLLVCTSSASYVVTGYTEDDIELNVSDPGLGAANHQACVVIHGRAWVPNAKGYFIFDGAWHQVMKDRLLEWQETYKANIPAFETSSYAVDDESESIVKLYTPITDSFSWWVADYGEVIPEIGGSLSQPKWENDDRVTSTGEYHAYIREHNEAIGRLLTFDPTTGNIYQENAEVAFIGTARLVPRHTFFGDPGGPMGEGKKIGQIWSYVQSEESAWSIDVFGGDEIALPPDLSVLPSGFHDDIAASAVSLFAPKTVHIHRPIKCTGRGFTFMYTVTNGKNWRFRGIGGTYGPGPASRGLVSGIPP